MHKMVDSKHSDTHCVENEAKHVEQMAMMGRLKLELAEPMACLLVSQMRSDV